MKIKTYFILASLLALLVVSSQANSQQRFHDEQLRRYANASVEIVEVTKKYDELLALAQAGEGSQSSSEVIRNYEKEVLATIESHRLGMQVFTAISDAIMQDPELLERVRSMTE